MYFLPARFSGLGTVDGVKTPHHTYHDVFLPFLNIGCERLRPKSYTAQATLAILSKGCLYRLKYAGTGGARFRPPTVALRLRPEFEVFQKG